MQLVPATTSQPQINPRNIGIRPEKGKEVVFPGASDRVTIGDKKDISGGVKLWHEHPSHPDYDRSRRYNERIAEEEARRKQQQAEDEARRRAYEEQRRNRKP